MILGPILSGLVPAVSPDRWHQCRKSAIRPFKPQRSGLTLAGPGPSARRPQCGTGQQQVSQLPVVTYFGAWEGVELGRGKAEWARVGWGGAGGGLLTSTWPDIELLTSALAQ